MDLKKTVMTLAGAAAFLAASVAAAYGNLTPLQADWELQQSDEWFILDVRTDSEWTWVGHPGINRQNQGAYLDGKVVNISYLIEKPDGSTKVNPNFAQDVAMYFDGDLSVNLVAMCRSGSRSQRAAEALEAAGFTNVYNMTTGFEGNRDFYGYRTVNGWKVDGLPYKDGRAGAYPKQN